ncbi:MAG: ABC transporter permease [Pseudolactococcus laudensis]|jgi:peptide/nickel transport system permease protein|uniref:ABC transporter permease n=1 Tax=Pseudolactococcus laudensis TaxID=1494461 RepID=UPI003F9D89E7|nr:ABC transporter permease [Lactococcus sp.]
MEKFKNLPFIKQIRQSVGLQRFMLLTGLIIILIFVLAAIFAPLLAPFSYSQSKADGISFATQATPDAKHLLGTTVGGLDVLSRVIWGSRTALYTILVSVVASLFLGTFLGLISGYFGGWLDRILVAIADAIYSFPSLLLAIVMAIMLNTTGGSIFGGIMSAGISITVVFVPQYLRVVRSEVMKIKNEAYIDSAKAIGASTIRILFRHVLKNSTRTLPVIITMNAAEAILTLAGLGFLGLGIEPSAAAEWGYDLNRSISDVTAGIWWTALFPGFAIVIVVIGITLLGEGLNDLADPRLRIRRKPTPFSAKDDEKGADK